MELIGSECSMFRVCLISCGLALILCMSGCDSSGGGPPTVRVAGTVILDGQPLENVDVHFISENHAGYGKTDADGKFKLVTGAVVGENKVYFSKIQEGSFGSGDQESGMDAGQADAAAMGNSTATVPKGQVIPPDFASAEKTRLTFNVPEGGTDSANFDLDTPK
jgi:hypothetical protein